MRLLKNKRVRWILHLVLLLLGVVAVALLIRHVGFARLALAMKDCVYVLPFVLALEGARIAADAWRTRLLYARAERSVGWRRLLIVQLASYPLGLLVPAGGAAAEAYKAAELADEVGGDVAAAAATINQALALFGGFVISIPCIAVAAQFWGPSGFTIAIAIQAATAVGLGVFIQFGTRQALVGNFVGRFSSRAAEAVVSYQTAVVRMSFLPIAPLGAAVLSRIAQLGQLALLAFAVGSSVGVRPAFLALGVQLVGGAAGDMVPAQIGALDASFALAAAPLGIDIARALTIPIAMHAVQLTWALIGALAPTQTRPKKPVEPRTGDGADGGTDFEPSVLASTSAPGHNPR